MEQDTNAIRSYFAKLGLASEVADIYLALHAHGPQTLSSLARTSGVERTRIYRLLGELSSTNLIEYEADYKRGLLKAAPIANLHILINQKEQEVASLKEELGLIERVLARNSLDSPTTRVQVYHGPEGLRQMHWNMLRTQTSITGYSFRVLDEQLGRPFMARWTDEFTSRQLKFQLLIGDDFVASWKSIVHQIGGERIRGIEYNYLNPSIFPITHSCAVYDDVTAYFSWFHGEVFGFEIHNRQIADAQRVLLKSLWMQSTPETRL